MHLKSKTLDRLVVYMRSRAEFENLKWELTEKDLRGYFEKGIRNFFGVVVSDNGDLIEDNEQPSFFMSYKSYSSN
jgi:hypothetical protein